MPELTAPAPVPDLDRQRRVHDGVIRHGRDSAVVREAIATLRLPATLTSVPTHSFRRKQLYRRRQSPQIRLWLLFVLFAGVTLLFFRIQSPHHTWLNYYLSVVWSLYTPLVVVGVIGAVSCRRRRVADRRRGLCPAIDGTGAPEPTDGSCRATFMGRTDRLLIVTVPTLLAPGNLPALERVVTSLIVHLPRHFDHFRVDVITEGDADDGPLRAWIGTLGVLGEVIRIVNVPTEYETPKRARFKTRANQFAMEARREAGENTDQVVVYHLDDDTHIGPDTAASLATFAESDSSTYLLAQGTLTFPHHLTPSRFCRMADSIRPADDLTRFAFFTGAAGTPLGGLHGEHLVIRADIEDEIGWDFPNTVIEDAYFALEFSRLYPGRSTTLNSYSYGASPASVSDLVRQRRRWIEGLLHLAFNRNLPLRLRLPLAYSIWTWSLAPLQFVGLALLLSFATGIDSTSPVSQWIVPVWGLCLAFIFWLYVEGLKVNLSASDKPGSAVLKAAVLLPAIYVITPVETYAAMLGIIRFLGVGGQKVSEVITKPM